MSSNIRNKLKGNKMKLFLFASAAFLYIGAFWLASPGEIMEGMNIFPIFLGVMLYAKLHKVSIGRYLYTALFGACLGPIITEVMYKLSFPFGINLIITSIIVF